MPLAYTFCKTPAYLRLSQKGIWYQAT